MVKSTCLNHWCPFYLTTFPRTESFCMCVLVSNPPHWNEWMCFLYSWFHWVCLSSTVMRQFALWPRGPQTSSQCSWLTWHRTTRDSTNSECPVADMISNIHKTYTIAWDVHWHIKYKIWSIYNKEKNDYNYALCSHRLRKEYEAIADKALTTPTDTEHLMALKEEISTATEKTLPQLETRVIEARHRCHNTTF